MCRGGIGGVDGGKNVEGTTSVEVRETKIENGKGGGLLDMPKGKETNNEKFPGAARKKGNRSRRHRSSTPIKGKGKKDSGGEGGKLP